MDSLLSVNSVFNSMESDSVAVYSIKGKQHLMLEDRYRVIESLSIVDFEFDRYSIYGIFDGHGGNLCSEYVMENIHMNIALAPSFRSGNFAQAVKEGFSSVDRSFLELANKKGYKDGSCGLICLWLRDLKKLVVANLGDSRAVLCRKGKAVQITTDHRPTSAQETERIINQGGSIPPNGRLFNVFSISRALGDKDFKIGPLEGILSSEPDIIEVPLTTSDYFIILASDGFWDVVSNDEAIVLTVQYFSRFSVYNLGKVTKELVNEALRRGSTDDITVLVLLLLPPIPK